MENSMSVNILIAALILTTVTEISVGLRIIHFAIPNAVESGEPAKLICEHDTEDEALYAVKWYKGSREFFRYTPKEIPAVKIFSFPGLNVDMDRTNSTHLVLLKATPKISGKYSCEVSADAPSFATSIVSGEMEVVVLPTKDVEIIGIKPYYQVGEVFQANCTCYNSLPSALLEWKINNFPAYPNDIIKYSVIKDAATKLETRTIGLHFLLSHLYFVKGKLTIQCIARIHNLYQSEAVRYIEEDRPHIQHSPSLSYLSDEEYNLKNAATTATATAASTTVATPPTKSTLSRTVQIMKTTTAPIFTLATIHAMLFGKTNSFVNVQKFDDVICTAAALISINFFCYFL